MLAQSQVPKEMFQRNVIVVNVLENGHIYQEMIAIDRSPSYHVHKGHEVACIKT